MYGVIRVGYSDGSNFESFQVFSSFELAQRAVNDGGGWVIKLVEVVEKTPPPKERSK